MNLEERSEQRQSLIKGEVRDDVDRRLLELTALFEISQLLNASLNLTSIVDNILLSPMGRMMINKGMFLLHRGKNQYEVLTVKGLPRKLLSKKITMHNVPAKPFLTGEESQPPDWMTFFEESNLNLFLPITLRHEVIGMVCFGKKLVGGDYLESEIEFLSSIANIAATSIQNGMVFEELKSVNARLDKKIQELNTLFDIGKELNSSLDSSKIVRLLAYGLMGEMMLNRFVIIVKRSETLQMAEKRGFTELEENPEWIHPLFDLSQAYLLEDGEYSPVNDHLSKHDAAAVIPMRSQDKTKGLLIVGPRISKKGFIREDLDFLTTLANQAMVSLENAWLFEDSLERKRLEEELLLARKIQIGLLPETFPDLGQFEVFGLNISSNQVGGDYFDVIPMGGTSYMVGIADVSGKGVPASLLMSNLQASLMALCGEQVAFDKLVAKVNNIIYSNTDSDKFITFFGGILDIDSGQFTYVNAGHNPPYRVATDGSLQTLDKGGLLLGMMPGVEYEHDTVNILPGEAVVMFTDGVSEAMNDDGEQYEEFRLEALLKKHTDLDARMTAQMIADTVSEFAGQAAQSDDITVVVIKRKPNRPE